MVAIFLRDKGRWLALVSRGGGSRSLIGMRPLVGRASWSSLAYHSFGRSTPTILRKGSSSTGRIAILPQFRALDTHDLTKGSHSARQDRNFTTVSGD